MLRFAHPLYIYALLLIPAIVIIYFIMLQWRKKALQQFGDIKVITRLFVDASKAKQNLKFTIITFAAALVIIGAADPQIGTKLEEVKRSGVDVMIAIDVSNSMKAEDIKPNRLERAKQAISKLIDKMQNDRIGIIVFAGKAYTQLPLTSDFGAAKLFLSAVDPDIVPTQGTAIGEAIRLGINSYPADDKKHRAMVIITDGDNHEDDAIAAAKEADSAGVIIHTIGMGSPNGAPIPIYYNGAEVGYKKDNAGNTVITKLDESLLQQIAAAANGKFIRANNSEDGLSEVMKEIDKMEKKKLGSKMYTDYEDRFQYFLAAALLLLISELLVSSRKSKFLTKLNLFGEERI
jgi:Ca-activated chloride channel family protein